MRARTEAPIAREAQHCVVADALRSWNFEIALSTVELPSVKEQLRSGKSSETPKAAPLHDGPRDHQPMLERRAWRLIDSRWRGLDLSAPASRA